VARPAATGRARPTGPAAGDLIELQLLKVTINFKGSNMSATVPEHIRSVSFLGVKVQPTTISDLMSLVEHSIGTTDKCVIGNHNLHSLYLFHRRPEFRQYYKAVKWTHIDGMPLVALARLYGHRVNREQRVTYVDWIGPLMEAAAQNQWRIFYVGAKPGVAGRGAVLLRERYPGLRIRTMHGYFNCTDGSLENEEMLRRIEAYKPHVLMVGMGMPRQELWIHENFERLSANVILPSGAAIDYIAGAVPTPPRWAGRLCVEWVFRLFAEPQRLWRRYLIEPWSIFAVMAAGAKGFSEE
jgi:N-acetylglucosaminyldiphosphoundecaprenol N-acetyl-beta-D-mannosaminyltransferase